MNVHHIVNFVMHPTGDHQHTHTVSYMEDIHLSGSDDHFDSAADEDLTLPRQTVAKLVQELMPDHFVCPKDSRDLLVACCTDFVHLVASEANEVCERLHKKTITADHFQEALRNLGFGEYCGEVEQALLEQQEAAKARVERMKGRKGVGGSGETEKEAADVEELARQQAELFEQARLKYMSNNNNNM